MRVLWGLVLAIGAICSSCEQKVIVCGGTAPRLKIAPAADSISVGSSLRFQVSLLGSLCPVRPYTYIWTVRDTSLVALAQENDSTVLITGRKVGATIVSVSLSIEPGAGGDARLWVVP